MILDKPIPRSEDTSLAGMMLAAAAFALLTSVDIIFKLMAGGHPAYQILFINGGFASVPIVGWALVTGGFERLHTERPLLHLIRGSVGVLSGICAINAYARLPLADFYAIVFSGPLIVAAMSSIWLGEKIEWRRWLAIASGFVGILVAMNPHSSGVSNDGFTILFGRLAALASIFCYAVSVIMIRRMRLGESNLTFSLYSYIASTLIGGTMLLAWGGPPLNTGDFAHLALSGLLAGTASICLMTAYHRSPVAVVAPFQYTQILWGALAGWLLWRHVPGMNLVAGAVIVAASGLYVIYREMRVTDSRKPIRSRRK